MTTKYIRNVSASQFIMLLLLALFTFGCQRSGVVPGAHFPDASFYTVEEEEVRIQDYLKKAPILLMSATSWCGECKKQFGVLKGSKIEDLGIQLFIVSDERSKDAINSLREEIPPFAKLLWDKKGVLKKRLKITGYPEFILIKEDATLGVLHDPFQGITAKLVGGRAWDDPGFLKSIFGITL